MNRRSARCVQNRVGSSVSSLPHVTTSSSHAFLWTPRSFRRPRHPHPLPHSNTLYSQSATCCCYINTTSFHSNCPYVNKNKLTARRLNWIRFTQPSMPHATKRNGHSTWCCSRSNWYSVTGHESLSRRPYGSEHRARLYPQSISCFALYLNKTRRQYTNCPYES